MWYNEGRGQSAMGRQPVGTPAMFTNRGFPETRPSLLHSLRGEATEESWASFFQRYAPAVMRAARYRGLDEHDADDVVQQVMVAIARHIKGFDYNRDRGRFRHWVRRIAESKIADHFRHRPPVINSAALDDEVYDQPTADEAWEAVWENEWRLQDINYCLENIRQSVAPRTFEAFRLYVIDGVSAADTAAAVGMSTHHVHVIRCQLLRRVKREIERLQKQRR